jgi:hypothetical protein
MQLSTIMEKMQQFFEDFQSRHKLSRCLILLCFFLFAVLAISYIIPFLDYGRFFGTDDYTHLYHTEGMASTNSTYNFYSLMGEQVSDPGDAGNIYNYPFGLWLYGSLIAKVTGLGVFTGNFFGIILFLVAIIGTFYLYSGLFLSSKEQKIVALLFMVSMPNVALLLLNFRPSVFILPFLFIILYFSFNDSFDWKQMLIVWLSIFVIIVSHTGTFIFLISFSLGFFLLYCLLGGKFSRNTYITIISTFFIYLITLNWFPEISNQFEVKSTLFLTPGDFLATKFNILIVRDFGNVFYNNFLVEQQLIYAILFGIALFGTAKILIYIHQKASSFFSDNVKFSAFVLPVSNISHSIAASPIWLGPIHVILSLAGIFRLDTKGKCLFLTVFITTFIPDWLGATDPTSTGSLREISFMIIIVPITATLGFWWALSYLKEKKIQYKNQIVFIIWLIILTAIILTPALGTTYYLPKIAGEDYAINGMKWLGDNGNVHEKVVGYGYRTVPVFTNMSDASYGVRSGTDTRLFTQLLNDTHFSLIDQEQNVNSLRQFYGVKYIITSDRVIQQFSGTRENLTIDTNQGLDKIYASRDFGIYEISSFSDNLPEFRIADNITLKKFGSVYQIKSDYYSAVVNDENPTMTRFGTAQDNYFGGGFLTENLQITGTGDGQGLDDFEFSDMQFTSEITNNQIRYKSLLNTGNVTDGTLNVIYTFYPKVIKREYIITNDWYNSNSTPSINARFSSGLFSPLMNFIVTNNADKMERFVYESLDTVYKDIKIQDIYLFNSDNSGSEAARQGIHISYLPTSPFPLTAYYKGSTLYNMSTVILPQTEEIRSGDSFHITQFYSTGDEQGSENNILSQSGIQLDNYPDGINPIIVCGLGSSFSDNGYKILNNFSIPYSEIVAEDPGVAPGAASSNSPDLEMVPVTPATSPPPFTLRELKAKNIGLIGSADLGPDTDLNNFTTQKSTIGSLGNYAAQKGVSFSGFMASGFRYNLDTIKILYDKSIPFMLSDPVNPPDDRGIYDEGYRNPRMAYYQDKPTGLVILPVSYPASSSLAPEVDNDETFAMWHDTLTGLSDNDEVLVFLFRSSDIGNPDYSGRFINLFSSAKQLGYTFSSPEIVTDHFRNLQNIHYTGFTDIDTASVNIVNNNSVMVRKVTFKITLDNLTSGNYTTNQGRIVKIKKENESQIIYVSTDIPAHSTQNLIIKPDFIRKKLHLEYPAQLTEGTLKFTIRGENNIPLTNAVLSVDTTFYRTDDAGDVNVVLHRGIHKVTVQSPGYEKVNTEILVKGRVVNIQNFFSNPLGSK